MQLVLSEWALEGAARDIWAWGDSYRTFSEMDLEERWREHLLVWLRDHKFQFGALEKLGGKMHTSCGHGEDWNEHFRRKRKDVRSSRRKEDDRYLFYVGRLILRRTWKYPRN